MHQQVSPLLHFVGVISRCTPYFRGKWRLIDWVFNRFQRRLAVTEVVRIGSNIAIECELWDEVQNNIWWLGASYEVNETKYFTGLLRSGMVVMDVGANVGYYSLIASNLVSSKGIVHAFEPIESQFQALCANIERNRYSNILPNRKIVSDSCGYMAIYLGPECNSGAASVIKHLGNQSSRETVQSITIDAYLESQGPRGIDVIKIDTEGHELAVLKGAAKTLASAKPELLIEVQQRLLRAANTSREELYSYLYDHSYKAFAISSGGRLVELKAPQDGKLIVFKRGPGK